MVNVAKSASLTIVLSSSIPEMPSPSEVDWDLLGGVSLGSSNLAKELIEGLKNTGHGPVEFVIQEP